CAKVTLAPGERRRLRCTLDQRAFSTWDSAAQRWSVPGGQFTVSVGNSSRNLPLSAPVRVPITVGAQSVGVTAPRLASAGDTATVTTTFTNTGDLPVWQVRTGLDAPAGWPVTALTRSAFPVVPAHSAVQTTW